VSSASGGKWLSDFIYVHHLQRYTDGEGHREPFYYYFTTLPTDFLPWTIFAVPAVFTCYRRYRGIMADPVKLFLVLWFLVVFVFFSASDTKRDLYLMPLLPVAAFFVAHYMDDLAARQLVQGTLYGLLTVLFFAVVVLEGLLVPLAAWFLWPDVFWISLPAAAIFAAGGSIAIYFVKQKKPLELVAAIALMMVCTLGCAAIWIFPFIERFKSRRVFSMEVQRMVPATATLYIYDDKMNDFNYYTQREVIPVLYSRPEVEKLLNADSRAYMLIHKSDLDRLDVISPERIRIAGGGNTRWNLVALGSSPANK
jgi:4-amino-4-deoxy-L-arabinose transferase-like glycosyltransferase